MNTEQAVASTTVRPSIYDVDPVHSRIAFNANDGL